MAITAAMVKELRVSSGAGMMDAKKALVENDGDMEAATDWLRTKWRTININAVKTIYNNHHSQSRNEWINL